MQEKASLFAVLGLVIAQIVSGAPAAASSPNAQIEPTAGTWKTWVLASGAQLRLPAPPDAAASKAEIAQLESIAAQRDAAAIEQVKFWDSGAPGYRWDQIARDELVKHGVVMASAGSSRALSLLDVAIYDATVAAWDSKYTYNRERPADADPNLQTLVATPRSPSYPSEHAAVAAAAASVLSYLYPDEADALASLANEAAQSRVIAGVQYPSDVSAGTDLGRRVADLVIERGRHDGSEAAWTGSIPTDPSLWNLDGCPFGITPVTPNFGSYKPWALDSGSQFRPGPPPAPDSEQKQTELAEIKDFNRTFLSNSSALFWQSSRSLWSLVAEREAFEAHLDQDPPRAAQVNAMMQVAAFDATVACWDAKFTYWARRPFQLDPDVHPLFQTPAHPSYPSAHGCVSGAQGAVLAALFPSDAAFLNGQADEAANSRIWAGIHFRSDIDAGLTLGRSVAAQVVQRGVTP